jgi:glucokinase
MEVRKRRLDCPLVNEQGAKAMRFVVGIDLGGTNIKAGLVDESGRLLRKKRTKTQTDGTQDAIVQDMALLARSLMDEENISDDQVIAVGVGAPGTPDNAGGNLIYANNLPFRNVPIRSIMRKFLDRPTFVDNDANVAALAESVAGAARNTSHSVTLTLGTGVGGGVVIHKQIYSGFNHAGCEIGHMVIRSGGESCTCGRRGCFEAYASATALIRETERAARAKPTSLLNQLIADNGGHADGRTAFIGMRQGDQAAQFVVDDYTSMIAEGLANVINLYMPEVIALGGGVCHEGEDLLRPVREKAIARAYLGIGVPEPRIVLAELGNDAGMIGAAMMAVSCLEQGLEG